MDYPFRIQSAATSQARINAIIAQGAGPAAPPQAGADPLQQYLARVLRLIPAEVVSLYQGVYGIVKTAAANDTGAQLSLVWLPWLGAALVIFVRAWGTRDSTGALHTVQWGAVAIAVVSFFVWVISLGNPNAGLNGHLVSWLDLSRPWLGSILLMICPFFIEEADYWIFAVAVAADGGGEWA
jgi:hypothetical protein